jgi:hypothetical protein
MTVKVTRHQSRFSGEMAIVVQFRTPEGNFLLIDPKGGANRNEWVLQGFRFEGIGPERFFKRYQPTEDDLALIRQTFVSLIVCNLNAHCTFIELSDEDKVLMELMCDAI